MQALRSSGTRGLSACRACDSVVSRRPAVRGLLLHHGAAPRGPAAAAAAVRPAPELRRPEKRPKLGPSQEAPPPQQQQQRPAGGGGGDCRRPLEAVLGYQFSRPELLDQALTHCDDRAVPSYAQLAFLGDAALWLVFAEYAFLEFGGEEDPVSGAWPVHMSALLSRANCAANARAWGLQDHLRHHRLGSGGAGGRGPSGMRGGRWSSAVLAEAFEGLMGALLLDSDYRTASRVLRPWVAREFAASRAAVAAAAAGVAAPSSSGGCGGGGHGSTGESSSGGGGGSGGSSSGGGSSEAARDAAGGSGPAAAAADDVVGNLADLLHAQLWRAAGLEFDDRETLRSCGRHAAQLLLRGGQLDDPQGRAWQFVGFALLRFAAVRHAYASESSGGCSGGGGSGSGGSPRMMTRRVVSCTNCRHRAKMLLVGAGFDPAPLLPPGAALLESAWKVQKRQMSACLDVLLAAVYVDRGLDAALALAAALLSATPPTDPRHGSWAPAWARRGSGGGGASGGGNRAHAAAWAGAAAAA